MAIKSTYEQIEEVQSAITNILLGQEVVIDGTTWRSADLDSLQRRETMLLKRYHAEQGGGLSVNAVRVARE